MFAFDRDCRIIAWNRAMQRISGFSREAVLGKRVGDIFPFLQGEGNDDCFAAALEGKETVSEYHPYGPSETGLFESHYSPLLDLRIVARTLRMMVCGESRNQGAIDEAMA